MRQTKTKTKTKNHMKIYYCIGVALVETSNIALNFMGQLHIAFVMPRFY
jgi:hypothetical protein